MRTVRRSVGRNRDDPACVLSAVGTEYLFYSYRWLLLCFLSPFMGVRIFRSSSERGYFWDLRFYKKIHRYAARCLTKRAYFDLANEQRNELILKKPHGLAPGLSCRRAGHLSDGPGDQGLGGAPPALCRPHDHSGLSRSGLCRESRHRLRPITGGRRVWPLVLRRFSGSGSHRGFVLFLSHAAK